MLNSRQGHDSLFVSPSLNHKGEKNTVTCPLHFIGSTLKARTGKGSLHHSSRRLAPLHTHNIPCCVLICGISSITSSLLEFNSNCKYSLTPEDIIQPHKGTWKTHTNVGNALHFRSTTEDESEACMNHHPCFTRNAAESWKSPPPSLYQAASYRTHIPLLPEYSNKDKNLPSQRARVQHSDSRWLFTAPISLTTLGFQGLFHRRSGSPLCIIFTLQYIFSREHPSMGYPHESEPTTGAHLWFIILHPSDNLDSAQCFLGAQWTVVE